MFDLLVEFIGTFVFLSVILAVGEPIPIVVALLAAIYFAKGKSMANFNPAISTMLFAKGDMGLEKYIGYLVAQILGGLTALVFYKMTLPVKTK